MNPTITLAVQCHFFQRRLAWMLSSLRQQTEPHHVVVDIAHMPENGDPTTEAVIDAFDDLNVVSSVWEDYSAFQLRGLVRNRQVAECQTKWLFFTDCDMIFHPEYFERLRALLRAYHEDCDRLMTAGRMISDKFDAIPLVDGTSLEESMEVPNAYDQTVSMPLEAHYPVGAGNFQLINYPHLPHGGYYVKPEENKDQNWDDSVCDCFSDVQFRGRMLAASGPLKRLPAWFGQNVIHLNHRRDKQEGYHLEEQR